MPDSEARGEMAQVGEVSTGQEKVVNNLTADLHALNARARQA